MDGVTSTLPTDRSTFTGMCGAANAFSKPTQDAMLGSIYREGVEVLEQAPAPAKAGFTPLEVFGG